MKPLIPLLLTLLICLPAMAQQRDVARLEVAPSAKQGVDVSFTLGDYSLESYGADRLEVKVARADSYSMMPHTPHLPLWQQMIEVPEGAEIEVEIGEKRVEKMALHQPLRMVRGTLTKSGRKITSAVKQDQELIEVRMLGRMRGVRMALVTIRPFRVKDDTLSVCSQLQGSIRFLHADETATTALRKRYASPFFSEVMPGKSCVSNNTYGNTAVGYLVLAPSRFRETLQPFVQWKRECGYAVTELYDDHGQRDSLRSIIQGIYDSSSAENPFASFLLLVGNTADIPPFFGTHSPAELDVSFSDLPYADYSGDCLPDILLGRWPVSDTLQLRHVVEKTLAYEQCRLEDESYLNRALLVSGNEGRSPAPAYTNAQVGYLSHAFAHRGLDTTCFYNPAYDTLDPSWSAQRKSNVLEALAQGVGHVNYTGHAKYFGWTSPTVSGNDLNALPSDGRYAFVVNNCCRSCEFGGGSMGEQWLRKPQGGAVAVIGATNETLWDEDFFWSVGQKDTLIPLYDTATLGAYDRLIHSHGENPQQWVANAAQMLLAGNMAVMESGSPYAEYYWENYLLMGDPSLVPYVGVPASMTLTCRDSITPSTTSVSVEGTPGAWVAMAERGALLGVCRLDGEGQGVIALAQPPSDSVVTLTANLVGYRPVMDTLPVASEACVNTAQESLPLHLYPNPARREVTIEMGGIEGPVQIEIRDLQGRLMDVVSNNFQQQIQYSTHHLRFGIYLVVVRNAHAVVVKKLTIQP